MSDIELSKNEVEFDFLDIVRVLINNIKIITIITITTFIIAIAISIASIIIPPKKSFMPNTYSAKSTIMLNSTNGNSSLESIISSSGVGALAGLAGISGGSEGTTDADLAIKLATTNSFIDKLNKTFNLDSVYEIDESHYPLTTLRNKVKKNLSLKLDDSSGMLEIIYTDIDKTLATDIVNKATEFLEEEFTQIDKIRNKSQHLVVDEKIAVVELEMKNLQHEIIKFQLKHNILDVSVVSAEIVKLVSKLQSQLLEKEVEIESYGKVANIKDPVYIKKLNERDAILNAIKKLEDGEVGDYPPIKELPTLAFELEELKKKLEIQTIGYRALIQQSETLKLTAEGTGPTFQVLERAEVPEMKSGPSRGRFSILLTFVGFFFSIIFAFIKEAYFNIKNNPQKMAKLKGGK